MKSLATFFAAAGLLGASVASADDAAPSPAASTTTSDGFVLPKGKALVDAYLELDLSSDRVFKPVSFAPDIWYGVTDDLTLGLVHSGVGATGFLGAVGDSLCLTGSDNGCAHVYNNVGLDGRYRIARPWSIDAGLYITSISDPFQLAVKAGVDGRWVWNKVALQVQPSLFIGLTNREPDMGPANTETLFIPATVSYLVAPKVDLALQAGVALPFTNTSDTWSLPLSIAARFAATPRLGLGLAFSFPDLVGGNATTDLRSLTLGGTYAF